MEQRRDFYVYVIEVDSVVRYVGRGCRDRMAFHLNAAKRILMGLKVSGSTRFHARLAEALSGGSIASARMLFTNLSDAEALDAEIAEIARIGRSALWNKTNGGDGLRREDALVINGCPVKRAAAGKKISLHFMQPEANARLRETRKRQFDNPETRRKQKQAVKASWTPERQQAQADRLRQRWASMAPQERKATAAARNKPIETPDRKEQRSSIAKSRHLADPSLAIATIARNQAMWSNPASGLRNRRDPSPEVKAAGYAKVGASTKRRWADRTPEEKARLANQTSETLKRRNAERRLAEGREIVRVRTRRRKYATT